MPQLYEKLVELNVRRRTKFIPEKSNQPLKLLNEEDLLPREDITNEQDTFDGEDTTGLGVEDTCTEFQETEIREHDLNDESENIIVSGKIPPRYNLRSRQINMTSVKEREQLKMNSIKEREHLKKKTHSLRS